MMLKLAFEPEHALEVEEITGFSNTITGRLIWEMGLEEDKLHGTQTYVNSPTRRVWKGVKLHGTQTSSRSYSGEAGFRRR